MARFTSIGMPKKTFVASAAEESGSRSAADAPPPAAEVPSGEPVAKKRKRRGTRGKVIPEGGEAQQEAPREKKAWNRDPNVAKRAKLSAEHAFARREKRHTEKNVSTTCFACRSVGHAARDCPNVLLAMEQGGEGSATLLGDGAEGAKQEQGKGMKRKKGKKGGDVAGGHCYRCGGTDHSLKECPVPLDPKDPYPHATCFICLGTGHLSSVCPSNPGRGIYPNGGSCKVCNSTAHRANDCPEEAKQRREFKGPRRGEIILGTADGAGADEDDFMIQSRENLKDVAKSEKGKRKKHVPANNSQRGLASEYSTTSSIPRNAPAEEVEAAPKPAKKAKKVIAF